jgi:putative glycosyltransferase (TIGR04372 family)
MIFSKFFDFLNKLDKFPYYFIAPCPYAIGTASYDLMYGYCFSKYKNKKIIVLLPFVFPNFLKYQICNKTLFKDLFFGEKLNLIESFYQFFSNFFFNIEFFVVRSFVIFNDKFFKIKLHEYIRFLRVGNNFLLKENILELNSYKNIIKNININYNNVVINDSTNIKCKNILLKNKFIFEKFICIHTRDESYRNDYNRRIYRNSSIDNFTDAIKYLINQGFGVVRLGDIKAKKTSISNKNFLDYPFTDLKSEEMDMYLLKNCFFYIGTNSGPLDIARLFGKPTLIHNMINPLSDGYPLRYFDRGYLKKVKYKNEELSLLEFLKLPFKFHNPCRDISELKFIESDAYENYINIKEYCELIKDDKISYTKLQKNFNNFFKENIKNFFKNEFFQKKNDSLFWDHNAKKIIFSLEKSSGTLTDNYLNKNYYEQN